MTRVAVFIDYQNVYHGARAVFGSPSTDPPTVGHVKPLRLGQLLTDLGKKVDPSRELTEVTVYRGRPGAKSHPNLQSAFARQVAAWERTPRVTVRTRPLRYQPIAWSSGTPSEWRAEEKGIDVLIALDIALGALDDRYDIAVLVSADTDLVPAIEVALDAGRRVETATWVGPVSRQWPLRVPTRSLWNHRLDERLFGYVRDDTNYLAS